MIRSLRNITTTTALQVYRFVRYSAFFITAILLAKMGVDQEEIGAYEWVLHLLYTLSFFWVHGFSQSFLIRSGKSKDSDQDVLLRNLWGLSLLISILLFILLYLLGDKASLYLLGLKDVQYWQLYLVLILVGLPPLVFEYLLIAQKQSRHLIAWGIFSNLMHVLCTILPFLLGYGLYGMLLAHIGLNALRCLYMLIILGLPKLQLKILKQWKGAFQLSLYTIIGGLPVAFDTWLVGYYTQAEEQVAIFRYGARELPLIMILLGSIHVGMLSSLASTADQLDYLKKKVLQTMHWLGPMAIVLLFLSPFLYPLLFNSAFEESAYIFNVYLLILSSRWILSHTVAMAYEEYTFMNIVALVELTLNVILSFWWIESWGLAGVAMATIIAFMFEKVALMIYLFSKHNIQPGRYLPWKTYALYNIGLIIAFVISSVWLF